MLDTPLFPLPELHTERLLLRKLVKEDAPAILRMRGDESVMRYIDRERSNTLAEAEIFINKIQHSLDTNQGITWAITLKIAPADVIGTIGFWRMIREHHRAEIGYMLHPDYWRKGIMKEALLKVIDMGFNTIKLHSIEAHINPDNKGSASILLSVGFVKEACFRENFYFNGSFRDTEIYSLLNKQQ